MMRARGERALGVSTSIVDVDPRTSWCATYVHNGEISTWEDQRCCLLVPNWNRFWCCLLIVKIFFLFLQVYLPHRPFVPVIPNTVKTVQKQTGEKKHVSLETVSHFILINISFPHLHSHSTLESCDIISVSHSSSVWRNLKGVREDGMARILNAQLLPGCSMCQQIQEGDR